MTLKSKTILATLPILVLLGSLVFASASGVYAAIKKPLEFTMTEDSVLCKPQKNSSEDLWDCQDYYGNKFKNLQIIMFIE